MFTDRGLKGLKPGAKDYFKVEATGQRGTGRLALKVRTDGAKEFYFQYWAEGRRRLVKLGNYGTVSLAAAREEVSALARRYATDADVKGQLARERGEREREAAREASVGTFEQVLDAYLERLTAEGKRSVESVRASLKRYVREAHPDLLRRPAKEITASDIRDVLKAMIDRGVTTHANRVRAYLHAAFQVAVEADHNPRSYLPERVRYGLTVNPVAVVPRQSDWERPGERWLSAEEVAAVWNGMRGVVPRLAEAAVKLALALGGQRAGEVLKLRWADVDLQAQRVLFPAAVTKNRLDHYVPLGSLAMELLQELAFTRPSSEYVLPGGRGRGYARHKSYDGETLAHAVKAYCVETGCKPWTPRDLRRTAKTLMGAAGISKVDRDRLQNHAIRVDVSGRHYDRHDYLPEKAAAILTWDQWLRRAVEGKVQVAEVVALSA